MLSIGPYIENKALRLSTLMEVSMLPIHSERDFEADFVMVAGAGAVIAGAAIVDVEVDVVVGIFKPVLF
jgi:hypothetical protein